MTYLEKLNEDFQYIVKRHQNAIERNCSDKVKAQFKGQPYIRYVKYQPIEERRSDYEYLLFEGDYLNIELQHDMSSLLSEYHLREPSFFAGFPSEDIGSGFMVKLPEGWVDTYMNKEYVEDETLNVESPFYWRDWRCSEENLDKRYLHFNKVVERFIKNEMFRLTSGGQCSLEAH